MLDVEQRSGVTIVRLSHGKVNALDLDLVQAIAAAMRDVPGEAAVVITGAGNAFSAGVDLQRIREGGQSYVREFLPALSAAFMAVFDHSGPVVAAINGHAIAGGCVIAAACDVRVMSQGKIGLTELSVGVPFSASAMEICRPAIGPAAGRLVLTAALLDAAQAQAIGLVHDIDLPDALLDSALGRAQKMAQIPPRRVLIQQAPVAAAGSARSHAARAKDTAPPNNELKAAYASGGAAAQSRNLVITLPGRGTYVR